MNGKCYSLHVRSLVKVILNTVTTNLQKNMKCGNLSKLIKHIYFQCRLNMQKIVKIKEINGKEMDKKKHAIDYYRKQ